MWWSFIVHSYALISFRFLFLSIWIAESDCNSDFKIVFNLMLSSTMALEQCESKIFNRCSYSRFYRKKRTRHKFEKERKKSTQDAETNWKKDEIKFKQTLVHIKNYYDFFPLYFRIVVGRLKKSLVWIRARPSMFFFLQSALCETKPMRIEYYFLQSNNVKILTIRSHHNRRHHHFGRFECATRAQLI